MRRSLIPALLVLLAGCTSSTPPRDAHDAAVLGSPEALLWREPYSEIVVEVDHVRGREPSPDVLAAVLDQLVTITGKRVRLVGPDEIASVPMVSFERRSPEELLALHRATFMSDPDPDRLGRGETAYLHVLYPDGTEEEALGGVRIANAVFVFLDGFPWHEATDRIRGSVDEHNVLLHEIGHALGLVNCGTPMLAPREGDRCHSTNPESAMFAGRIDEAAPSWPQTLERFVTTGRYPKASFDEDDLADLASYARSVAPSTG